MNKDLNIELNEQFTKALDIMENSNKSIFITGKAGTGKSTLLEYFRQHTNKKIVVLAPTGVAALNVGGQTIHSFFGFKPDITKDKVRKLRKSKRRIIEELEAVIIDEISMVRADLLDCIDISLRLNRNKKDEPFGGVQMIFIGDLYQLPPVVTYKEKDIFNKYYAGAYFFNANVFRDIQIEFVELEKIYRQKDERFIEILNAIRNNTLTDTHIEILNKCVGKVLSGSRIPVITLTTTNKKAEDINRRHLESLHSKIYTYPACIEGEFDKRSYPAPEKLRLAVGAQVMLVNNDSSGRWVNGTLAKIVDIVSKDKDEDDFDRIMVKLANGSVEEVTPYTWEVFNFYYNEEEARIETETVGTFTQYPLHLAWAVTIHKSQGKTFPKVIIDFSRGTFAPGQAYVALSRCTSLEGISLVKPFKKGYVFTDKEIVDFLTNYQYKLSEEEFALDEKMNFFTEAIEKQKDIEIVYLKPNGDKTRRIIRPYNLGEMVYKDRAFVGLKAYCRKRREERVFRIDRILEVKEIRG